MASRRRNKNRKKKNKKKRKQKLKAQLRREASLLINERAREERKTFQTSRRLQCVSEAAKQDGTVIRFNQEEKFDLMILHKKQANLEKNESKKENGNSSAHNPADADRASLLESDSIRVAKSKPSITTQAVERRKGVDSISKNQIEYISRSVLEQIKQNGVFDDVRMKLLNEIEVAEGFRPIRDKMIGEINEFCLNQVDLNLSRANLRQKMNNELPTKSTQRLLQQQIEQCMSNSLEELKSIYSSQVYKFLDKHRIWTSDRVASSDAGRSSSSARKADKLVESWSTSGQHPQTYPIDLARSHTSDKRRSPSRSRERDKRPCMRDEDRPGKVESISSPGITNKTCKIRPSSDRTRNVGEVCVTK